MFNTSNMNHIIFDWYWQQSLLGGDRSLRKSTIHLFFFNYKWRNGVKYKITLHLINIWDLRWYFISYWPNIRKVVVDFYKIQWSTSYYWFYRNRIRINLNIIIQIYFELSFEVIAWASSFSKILIDKEKKKEEERRSLKKLWWGSVPLWAWGDDFTVEIVLCLLAGPVLAPHTPAVALVYLDWPDFW